MPVLAATLAPSDTQSAARKSTHTKGRVWEGKGLVCRYISLRTTPIGRMYRLRRRLSRRGILQNLWLLHRAGEPSRVLRALTPFPHSPDGPWSLLLAVTAVPRAPNNKSRVVRLAFYWKPQVSEVSPLPMRDAW